MMMDPNVRWLVVVDSVRASVNIESYLYASSKLIGTIVSTSDQTSPVHLIMVAEMTDVQGRAEFQAERIRSGLMRALVLDTYAAAVAALVEA